MNTLDTKETLTTLHRVNAMARMRKLTLHSIVRESREAGSLEALRTMIEQLVDQLAVHEQNITKQG